MDPTLVTMPAAPASALVVPRPRECLIACIGFFGAGAIAALPALVAGRPEASPLLLVFVVPAVGTTILTLPALLVAQQSLGLSAAPSAVIAAVIGRLVAAGRLALALAPVLLAFSMSRGYGIAALLALAVTGGGFLFGAADAIEALEPETQVTAWTLSRAWAALALAVGLALSWMVLS